MLKEVLGQIAKDSFVYGLGNGITRFVQLLTLPIIAKSLSPEAFGDWNMLALLAIVLNPFMIFGLDSAIIRFFYDDESKEYRSRLFSSGLILMIFICVCLLFLYLGLSGPALRAVNLGDKYTYAYYVTVFWMPGLALQLYLINWFKWTFQKWKFIASTFGYAALNLLSLLFVEYKFELTPETVLLTAAVSQWITVLAGLFLVREHITLRVDFLLLKMVIPYGLPFMIVMVIGALRNSLDRIFLSAYVFEDPDIVGLYSIAQRIGMIMNFFVFVFDIAFNPIVLATWGRPEAKKTFSRIQQYYLLMMSWLTLSLSAVAPLLIEIFATDRYLDAARILPIFFLANYFLGLYSFASIGISYSKKSYLTTVALVASLAVLYLINFLLTPQFKIWGVGAGLICSILTMLAAGYFFSNKYYRIDFDWGKNLVTVIVSSVLSFVVADLSILVNEWLNAALLCLGVNILFLGFVWIITAPGEREALYAFIRNGLRQITEADNRRST